MIISSKYIFFAFVLFTFFACDKEKEENSSSSDAEATEQTNNSIYQGTLDEMIEACKANPSYQISGTLGSEEATVYTGFADGYNFTFSYRIVASCEAKYSREELSELIGESIVNAILSDLEEWSSSYQWFAEGSIATTFNEAQLEQSSAGTDGSNSWVGTFTTKAAGTGIINISTSEDQIIGSFNYNIAGYDPASIAAGADIFASRATDQGTCSNCHGAETSGPDLNAAYINVCSDEETAGAILNGAYTNTGGTCSGDDLPAIDPHAFAGSMTEDEVLGIIAWIRSIN